MPTIDYPTDIGIANYFSHDNIQSFLKIEGLQGFKPCSVCFTPRGSVHDRLEIVTNIDEKNPSLLACSVHGLQVPMTQSQLVTEQVQSKIKKVFNTAGFTPASRPCRLSFNG